MAVFKENNKKGKEYLSHVENPKNRIRDAIRDVTLDTLDQIWEEIIDVTYFLWH